MDDFKNTHSPDELDTEHVRSHAIDTQMTGIQAGQQTISEQVLELEKHGIEGSVCELKQLLPEMVGVRTSLRQTSDARAQSPIQVLHIFDMPNEILREIFKCARGKFDESCDNYPSDGIEAIQKLRLTCWRFRDVGSPLLLHRLEVSLSASSLAHFDEVSRHASISKGIRSLQVRAAYWCQTAAPSLQDFLSDVAELMRRSEWDDFRYMKAHLLKYLTQLGSEAPGYSLHRSHAKLSKAVQTSRKRTRIILSCIRHHSRAETSQQDENQIIVTLRKAYERQKQLLTEQSLLLQNGSFVRKFATAVARLPTVSALSITDCPDFEQHPFWTELADPIYKILRYELSEPTRRFLKNMWSKHPLIELLYQLPLTVVRAGSPLTELRICVNSAQDVFLGLSEEQAREVVSYAERLKVLEIDCWLSVQATQMNHPVFGCVTVPTLVSLLLNGKNLTSVSLCFNPGLGQRPPHWSSEPLLALLPWGNLKEISLEDSFFQYDELSKHLEKLAPGTYIFMGRMHLVGGLWADLLDLLRAKADGDSNVRRPSGGDDEALGYTFDAFVEWDNNPSDAAAYIRGKIPHNPMRSPPDHDNMDTEDMDQEAVDEEN